MIVRYLTPFFFNCMQILFTLFPPFSSYFQRLILQILVFNNALFYKKSLFITPYFTCFREAFINELLLGFYCCPIKLFWSEVMFWLKWLWLRKRPHSVKRSEAFHLSYRVGCRFSHRTLFTVLFVLSRWKKGTPARTTGRGEPRSRSPD